MANFLKDYLLPGITGFVTGGGPGAVAGVLSARESRKESQQLEDLARGRAGVVGEQADREAAKLRASQQERGVFSSTYGAEQERRLRSNFLNDPTTLQLQLQANRAKGQTSSLLGQMLAQSFNTSMNRNILGITSGTDPLEGVNKRLGQVGNLFGIGRRQQPQQLSMRSALNDPVSRSTGIPSGFSSNLLGG